MDPSKVRDSIKYSDDCDRPRVICSKSALSSKIVIQEAGVDPLVDEVSFSGSIVQDMIKVLKENHSFVCGDHLFPEGHALQKLIVVDATLDCLTNMESQFYLTKNINIRNGVDLLEKKYCCGNCGSNENLDFHFNSLQKDQTPGQILLNAAYTFAAPQCLNCKVELKRDRLVGKKSNVALNEQIAHKKAMLSDTLQIQRQRAMHRQNKRPPP